MSPLSGYFRGWKMKGLFGLEASHFRCPFQWKAVFSLSLRIFPAPFSCSKGVVLFAFFSLLVVSTGVFHSVFRSCFFNEGKMPLMRSLPSYSIFYTFILNFLWFFSSSIYPW